MSDKRWKELGRKGLLNGVFGISPYVDASEIKPGMRMRSGPHKGAVYDTVKSIDGGRATLEYFGERPLIDLRLTCWEVEI